MKILMVCLGNICRSPLAEGILRDKVNRAGLHWFIDSAGTGGFHIGEHPHILSQKVALLHQINISTLQCRQFTKKDMLTFDLIFVMDMDNYESVKRISGEYWDEKKVSLLLSELYPGEERNVPDPWFGGEKDFLMVFDMLNKACDQLIRNHSKG